jgi:hypothetical protein
MHRRENAQTITKLECQGNHRQGNAGLTFMLSTLNQQLSTNLLPQKSAARLGRNQYQTA